MNLPRKKTGVRSQAEYCERLKCHQGTKECNREEAKRKRQERELARLHDSHMTKRKNLDQDNGCQVKFRNKQQQEIGRAEAGEVDEANRSNGALRTRYNTINRFLIGHSSGSASDERTGQQTWLTQTLGYLQSNLKKRLNLMNVQSPEDIAIGIADSGAREGDHSVSIAGLYEAPARTMNLKNNSEDRDEMSSSVDDAQSEEYQLPPVPLVTISLNSIKQEIPNETTSVRTMNPNNDSEEGDGISNSVDDSHSEEFQLPPVQSVTIQLDSIKQEKNLDESATTRTMNPNNDSEAGDEMSNSVDDAQSVEFQLPPVQSVGNEHKSATNRNSDLFEIELTKSDKSSLESIKDEENPDEISAFCTSIEHQLRAIKSTKSRLVVQNDISQAVFRARMSEIEETTSASSSWCFADM